MAVPIDQQIETYKLRYVLTYSQYREQIDKWTREVFDAGITTDKGKPIPITFWGVFLGISRKTHSDIYKLVHNTNGIPSPDRLVPKYYVRSVFLTNQLSKRAFNAEVKKVYALTSLGGPFMTELEESASR